MRSGVRVNAVAPAVTFDAAEMRARLVPGLGLDALVAKFVERRAIAGHSTPDDVAGAVSFLAATDSRFITGAVIPVDGGVTAGSGQPTF